MTQLPGLWYLSRASGLVLLVLLTLTVVVGTVATSRRTPSWWPRFATAAVHADLAVLTVALLIAHVAVTVVDGYVPITWMDAVVPFRSAYRPVALGLGTLAAVLVTTVLVTAAARRALPPPVWRRAHYLVYVAWPLAVAHGIAIGSDYGALPVLLTTFACIGLVTVAVVVRFTLSTAPGRTPLRVAMLAIPPAVGLWVGHTSGAGPW
jgi:predicted ferric reductase